MLHGLVWRCECGSVRPFNGSRFSDEDAKWLSGWGQHVLMDRLSEEDRKKHRDIPFHYERIVVDEE